MQKKDSCLVKIIVAVMFCLHTRKKLVYQRLVEVIAVIILGSRGEEVTLLALPYHTKGIIAVAWSSASWNRLMTLEKCSTAKAIQHTFSAQM